MCYSTAALDLQKVVNHVVGLIFLNAFKCPCFNAFPIQIENMLSILSIIDPEAR